MENNHCRPVGRVTLRCREGNGVFTRLTQYPYYDVYTTHLTATFTDDSSSENDMAKRWRCGVECFVDLSAACDGTTVHRQVDDCVIDTLQRCAVRTSGARMKTHFRAIGHHRLTHTRATHRVDNEKKNTEQNSSFRRRTDNINV